MGLLRQLTRAANLDDTRFQGAGLITVTDQGLPRNRRDHPLTHCPAGYRTHQQKESSWTSQAYPPEEFLLVFKGNLI